MNLALAKSFFPSVGQLTPAEQAAVIDFLPRFEREPRQGGFHLERLSGKAAAFHSARVNDNIRVVLHLAGDIWSALFVAHHDVAYAWADRHDIDRHPRTGVMQLIETHEIVREIEKTIIVPRFVDAPAPASRIEPPSPLFAAHADDLLLDLGLPERWLPTARQLTTEDQALDLAQRLPPDVGDRLLDLAAGLPVTPPTPVPESEALTSPDAQRSFYFAEDAADLRLVLAAPMAQWIAFLHPSQHALVTRSYRGPARVTGSAGTGKTVVALHRARHLARQGKRILVTTYTNALVRNLEHTLDLLCTDAERARITVSTVHSVASQLLRPHLIRPNQIPSNSSINALISDAAREHAPSLGAAFAVAEWHGVIEPQGIVEWPAYRDADRTGRGTGLTVRDRKRLWTAFQQVHETLEAHHQRPLALVCHRAGQLLSEGGPRPYDAVIVDEVQDLRPPELRFLAALAGTGPDALMVVGDAGQRIYYPGRFSLSRLGIETRGRAAVLRINYRTSHQIRRAADRLLGLEVDDFDGGAESRRGHRSVLTGPEPILTGLPDADAELSTIVAQIQTWLAQGHGLDALGIFAPDRYRAEAILGALRAARLPACDLGDRDDGERDGVRIGTMHSAKGLEFKAVIIASLGARQLPSGYARGQKDPQDRDDAIARERRLLYVAMTRARDHLHLTWHGPPSPFLADLRLEASP